MAKCESTVEQTRMGKMTIASYLFGILGVLAMIAAGGMVYGYHLGAQSQAQGVHPNFPVMLNADSAARGKAMSMATGLLNSRDGLEGLFILDHLTGELQFWVLNNKTGTVAAAYKADAGAALDPAKSGDADYVMTTGRVDFEGGRAGGAARGSSVCYIGDSNSGKVICYGVEYNRTTAKGSLIVLAAGQTRGVAERDQ